MTNIIAQAIALIFLVETNRGADTRIGKDDDVGPFQIRQIYVDDVNRILKLSGSWRTYAYEDRNDFEKSRQMVEIYLTHYCTSKRLGRVPTLMDYLRTHNGGVNGYRKQSTLRYWEKAIERYYMLAETDALRVLVKI